MADKDLYATYITSVAGLQSVLANTQADVSRENKKIRQKYSSLMQREQGKLSSFDSNIDGFEKSYAKAVKKLTEPENAPLGINLPLRIRPTATQKDLQSLSLEQQRLIAGISASLEKYHQAQAEELARQKAQAALRAREAKTAAAALAARQEALRKKALMQETKAPSKRKLSNKVLAAIAIVAVAIVVLLIIVFMLVGR